MDSVDDVDDDDDDVAKDDDVGMVEVVDVNAKDVVGLAAEFEVELEVELEVKLKVELEGGSGVLLVGVEDTMGDACDDKVMCKVVDEVTNVVVVLLRPELDTEPAFVDMETDVDTNELVVDKLANVGAGAEVETGEFEEIEPDLVDVDAEVGVISEELESVDTELIEVVEEAALVVGEELPKTVELEELPLFEDSVDSIADELEEGEFEAIKEEPCTVLFPEVRV